MLPAAGAALRRGGARRLPRRAAAPAAAPAALAAAGRVRAVTVWPQWPYDEREDGAKPLGDPRFRWPPTRSPKAKPAGTPLTPQEMEAERLKLNKRIWDAMVWYDWSTWQRRVWEMRERAIPYDEVTYTLLAHGYLLSHRHTGESAYHVLEEMRRAETHPALVRLNQRLLDSAFELQELGMRPESGLWRNVVRLSWHCAVRFQKKRRRRLRRELEALEPDDALALGPADAQRWLRGHDRLALPPASGDGGRARFLALAPRMGAPQLPGGASAPAGAAGAAERRGRRSRRAAGRAAGRAPAPGAAE